MKERKRNLRDVASHRLQTSRAVHDQMRDFLHQMHLTQEGQIFRRNPTTDQRLRDLRAAHLSLIYTLPPTHTFTIQTNIEKPVSNRSREVVTPSMLQLGIVELKRFDLFFNLGLLGHEARYSPFRWRWFAYPEVSSGRLHYHAVACVYYAVARLFKRDSAKIVERFNRTNLFGCSVKLAELNNEERQVSYPLKHLDDYDSLLSQNFFFWNECLPKNVAASRSRRKRLDS
jgi:hypothetical protein